jgi:hypothetical protein
MQSEASPKITDLFDTFNIISGRQFDGRSWNPSQVERTLYAARLVSGEVAVQHFMVKQAALITNAHPVYILAVLHASAAERAALERGEVTISALATRGRRIPETGRCAICSGTFHHFGNNPEPLARLEARVCDVCNDQVVIPARLLRQEVRCQGAAQG